MHLTFWTIFSGTLLWCTIQGYHILNRYYLLVSRFLNTNPALMLPQINVLYFELNGVCV